MLQDDLFPFSHVNAEIKFIRKLICGLDQKLTRPQRKFTKIFTCTCAQDLRT